MPETQDIQRSPFLIGVTVFANIFLIVFGADAVLSLADALGRTDGQAGALSGLQGLVADLALILSILTLFVVIFVPQLPKLILLPPILFALWAGFGAPPFSFDEPSTVVALAIAQVSLIAAVLLINKIRTGDWLLHAGLLPRKGHLVLRTLVSFAVLGVLLPLIGAALLLTALASTIETQTGGYLQFTAGGIEVRETVMRKGGKRVRLIGMVHVGEPRFYEELYASFAPSELVLAEGVTDRDGRLADSFSYEGLAELLGLKVQPQLAQPGETGKKPGGNKQPRTEPRSREPISIPATATRPRIIYADADVADFSPTTVRFLAKVGEFYSSKSFNEALDRLNAMGEEFTEADINGVFEDILAKRNKRVLAEFDKRVAEYDVMVVPWGAQHMPGLEADLRERGFTVETQRMLPVARYRTVIDRLMEMLRKPQSGTSFWLGQKMWMG